MVYLLTGAYFFSDLFFIHREAFCSDPDQVCVYHVTSNASLPSVTIGLQNLLNSPLPTVTCQDNSINMYGLTQESIGMVFDGRATVVVPGDGNSPDFCSASGAEVVVPAGKQEVFVVVASGTNYDPNNGNRESNFSFKGEDPYSSVLNTATSAAAKSYTQLRESHISDFSSIFNRFSLALPDNQNSSTKPTAELIYNYNDTIGDPYVENLLFDYGRYLFISSSRPGSLPPSLQGRWTQQIDTPWGSDYHVDVNLEMNHWFVEQVNLGDLTEPLWSYMIETWIPRGSEAAWLLYGSSQGWVVHDEINIFGYSG